jgi:hypothetical protein
LGEHSQTADIAISSSTYAFLRALGATLGISIGGLIFFGDARGGTVPSVAEVSSLSGDARIYATKVYAGAAQNVFIQLTVIMAVALLVSLLIQRHAMQAQVRTNHAVVSSKARP